MNTHAHMGTPASAGEAAEGLGREPPATMGGVTLPGKRFRVERTDDRWREYGIVSHFGYFEAEDGEEVPRRYQVIEIDTKHPVTGKPIRMTIVKGPSFRFVPNEVAREIVSRIAEEHGMRHVAFRMKGTASVLGEYTSSGLGMFLRFVGSEARDVRVGDPVAIGFVAGNSVDGSIAPLSFSGFTLRLACTNGAVATSELTAFRVRIEGGMSEVEDEIRRRLEGLLQYMEDEMETYRRWTTMQVDDLLARILAATMPRRYIEGIVLVGRKGTAVNYAHVDAWQAFNSVTDPLSHRNLEARRREELLLRLRRAFDVWQAVREGRMSVDEAEERLGIDLEEAPEAREP
ncbi:DUF932 domain-containing protein [Conexivisphaera calida]|uniref:DUF932 domain-containing protein n=1 Tax=Conexivisphaera calida TaxID=1874277 RepID=A0A4P2VDZ9_9ARCH|nr:DUF932 domain-containing protein [Conexivisphaera calida]BBE42062.1 hypothetical protein NAS2_0673 [Conexivisphaera calida]